MHSEKLSKDCQKEKKKKCQVGLFLEVGSTSDFVDGNIRRDNLSNITAGCL